MQRSARAGPAVEEVQRVKTVAWVDSLMQDVRYAARSLWAARGFTTASVATLAIGIGATVAIFSTVNATLLRPLPFPRADDLIGIRTRLVDGRVTTGLVSPIELGVLDQPGMPVDGAAGVSAQPLDATLIGSDGKPADVLMSGVSSRFFHVLGVPLILGTGFTDRDFVPSGAGAPTALILSYSLWVGRFARDPAIAGKTLRIAEFPGQATVVGVAPPAVDLPHGTDIWFAQRIDPRETGHLFAGVLRMRPGTRIERLRSAADGQMAGLARTLAIDAGRQYVFEPLLPSMVGDLGPTLLIVLGAAALLLLLACVNVTNLLLARGTARTREVAVRAALGASRSRLIRQLLTEALMIACAGALIALGLAYAAMRLMLTLGASRLPRLDTVPFDNQVLLFASERDDREHARDGRRASVAPGQGGHPAAVERKRPQRFVRTADVAIDVGADRRGGGAGDRDGRWRRLARPELRAARRSGSGIHDSRASRDRRQGGAGVYQSGRGPRLVGSGDTARASLARRGTRRRRHLVPVARRS